MSDQRKFVISMPSETELVMEREFDAPRELVFKAHLDPEIIPLWWGPRGYTPRWRSWMRARVASGALCSAQPRAR